MKKFHVVNHPVLGQKIELEGFTFWGLFFPPLWLIAKKLYRHAALFFMATFTIVFAQKISITISREIAIILWVLGISLNLLVGFRGRRWVLNSLERRGFDLQEIVVAYNKDAVLAELEKIKTRGAQGESLQYHGREPKVSELEIQKELSETEIRDNFFETYNKSDLPKCKEHLELLKNEYPDSLYIEFLCPKKLDEINKKSNSKKKESHIKFLESQGYTVVHERLGKWVIGFPNKTGSAFVYSHEDLKKYVLNVAEQNNIDIALLQ
ncbi:MAG: DUF2628 domain-containing protein [Desulfobacteraceae bacterium]|nr:DUF2628 domain-containing protein [Desulfobacteraceae bacterium]